MKKIILSLLILSLVIESIIAFLGIFLTDNILSIFKIDVNNQNLFLASIIGWLCLFVSMIISLAIYYLIKNHAFVFDILYCLGIFWVLIGIGIYINFQKPDNIFLDSIKGLLLIILTYKYQQNLKNEN